MKLESKEELKKVVDKTKQEKKAGSKWWKNKTR